MMIIPELTTGGAQRSFSQLSRDLSEHHEVHVVIFNSIQAVQYETGATLHYLDVSGGSNLFVKAFKFLQRIARLRKLKATICPHVSISFLEGADYINILSSMGEKTIISIRGSKIHDREIQGGLGVLRRKILIPWLYRQAYKIVTVSEELRSELIKHFNIAGSHVVTIYNYYDYEKISALANEPRVDQLMPLGTVLITVGRLHQSKNHNFLIHVFERLREKDPNAKLVIIGDGPLRDLLLQTAKNTGLNVYSVWDGGDKFSSDIYFFGERVNPFPFLLRSSWFILSSLYEGFPNVLVEAMMCGVPVISADCHYGPREILAPATRREFIREAEWAEFGILLPHSQPSHIAAWTETISKIITDRQIHERYANAARTRAKDFLRNRILIKWFNVIEN